MGVIDTSVLISRLPNTGDMERIAGAAVRPGTIESPKKRCREMPLLRDHGQPELFVTGSLELPVLGIYLSARLDRGSRPGRRGSG